MLFQEIKPKWLLATRINNAKLSMYTVRGSKCYSLDLKFTNEGSKFLTPISSRTIGSCDSSSATPLIR